MCTRERERERLNILINGERELNILVIKIHLENNNNSQCVESTVANLFYFYFTFWRGCWNYFFLDLLSKYGFWESIGEILSILGDLSDKTFLKIFKVQLDFFQDMIQIWYVFIFLQ